MSAFIDEVRIEVRSGDGGNGLIAWRREKYEPMGGPYGGNGGRGGNVYLQAGASLSTLIDFRYKSKFLAQSGGRGGPKCKHGRSGADLVIQVPMGTVVKDAETDKIIADLKSNGERIMVAEGGRGGRGNAMLASPTHRAPHHCEPGEPGITRIIGLELKILADVGIIGLPNAGKSTLLSVMTNAKPKIADYPFSTLSPNLGVVKEEGGGSYVIADIPGLVEGAAEGIGLGHMFLRHIERTYLLVHLVDINAADVLKDIATVNRELALYSSKLSDLPQVLALNKADIIGSSQAALAKRRVEEFFKRQCVNSTVFVISAATTTGVDELSSNISRALAQLRQEERSVHVEGLKPDLKATDHTDKGFLVYRKKNIFTVQGDRVERLLAVTDLRSPESLYHLHKTLRSMGVVDVLAEKGAQPGSEVIIGEASFIFGEELA